MALHMLIQRHQLPRRLFPSYLEIIDCAEEIGLMLRWMGRSGSAAQDGDKRISRARTGVERLYTCLDLSAATKLTDQRRFGDLGTALGLRLPI
jgi:hypothetical protein